MAIKNMGLDSQVRQLRKFTVHNFKAFQHCAISLAPMTIFIGENSSGKSSLLQALLLVKQTLESIPKNILELNSHYVQFHQFREIVFGMPTQQAKLSFEFEFEELVYKDVIEDVLKIGFTVGEREESFGIDLLKLYVNNQNISVENFSTYPFLEFLFSRHGLSHEYIELNRAFQSIGYVQPIRPAPKRYYDVTGAKPQWMGVQAENIADYLEGSPEVKEKVRTWFVKSAKLVDKFKFKTDRKRGQMEILVTEPTTGFEIDISRLGFGYSQILPIVVAAFSDMNMLIFEAPEIHLNPNLHGALTDLFIEAAKNDKQILVETHSEHLIYRVQRRIADGTISPEAVAIYYVQRGEEGSTAQRLTLTKDGEIPDWPGGFFEAEVEDIYERIMALRD